MKTLEKLFGFGKKALVYTAFGLATLLPVKADAQQPFPCSAPPEYCEAMLNPFFQPNDTTLIWYGSGDVDSNNVIDWNDYYAMQQGTQNDMADVDGDGTPSTTQDQQVLADYLNNNIEYLPGQWNYLQIRDERDSWLEKMLAIDQTDTLIWHDGSIEDRFISGNFATQLCLNFWGWKEGSIEGDTLWSKYDSTNIGRFNLPVYFVVAVPIGSPSGHGMNVILTGDDPLNLGEGNAIEPQDDSTNVQPGGWNIPYNSVFTLYGPNYFNNPYGSQDMISGPSIVYFYIDSLGNDSAYYRHPNLILERPPVAIAEENPEIPSEYALNQNYPNPFNPRTTIEYTLPKREHVSLDIYDIRGTKLETLVDGMQDQGHHKVQFDASRYSSGIYFYSLRGEDYAETKKMVLVK